jgi:hypothetical protein
MVEFLQTKTILGLVMSHVVELQYCATQEQTANIFTKPFGPYKFVKFKDELGVVSHLTIRGG